MRIAILPLLVAALAASTALAATDGTLGPTSTGSVTITATVPMADDPTQGRISGLDDFVFGELYPERVTWVYDEFCIYHPTGVARIRVTQPGRDPSGPLGLNGPGGVKDAIRMTAVLYPDASDGGTFLIASHQYLLEPATYNQTSPDCSSGRISRLGIELFQSASAPQGNYQETLQLTVEPE